jgi:MobA/MobL family
MTAAGFYHCSVKSVGRTAGRSVVAAAAYRGGMRLVDERTGEIADYRARGGVDETFVVARADASARAQDIGRLWNEAERAEPRANGRLATEIVVALPHELDAAGRRQLAEDFARPIAERYGIAAQVSIHAPDKEGDQRNHHAHILFTHREFGPDGFGEVSNARAVMKKNKKGVFKETMIYGIAANPADIIALRKEWEQTVNRAYERAGLDIRVDHRSHEERGIQQEPTKHLGPTATDMERREPGSSDRGDVNREITQRNAEARALAALEAEARDLGAQIIDIKAERAMQEAREAAKGRYDSLRETHREVARDQFPGRYDELRAAEPPPEIVRAFESNASRAAEPAAPIYDRDADNAAWEAKLADAAIAAQEARQQPGASVGKETRAGGPEPSGTQQRPEPEDTRPLGKTAGEIRTAWTLSRSAGELDEALAARGMTLAAVTADEARQSERRAAFAKEIGNFARVFKEGEIVAVSTHGDVHRLDQRTTGDLRPEIEARLSSIDRAGLLSVTDAKEVMQEAARAAWRSERQAEREKALPTTGIETAIAEALTTTLTGTDFAAALDKAGLTITRATERDVPALDALRQDEDLAALAAKANGEYRQPHHFASLEPGDFAAVTRSGDVWWINPHTMDLEDIEQRLADTQTRMPSVVEARAQSEINREAIADLWAERRAENARAAELRSENREAERDVRATDAEIKGAAYDAADAVDAGLGAAGRSISRLAKAVESVLGGIFSFFGGGETRLSPMQRELAARANEELAGARAAVAAMQEMETAQDWQIFQQDKQRQQEELERETGHRERPGDRERERQRGDWL